MKLCFSFCISASPMLVNELKQLSAHFFPSLLCVPGQQTAIMEKGLLQVDTSVFHRCHNLAIMKPLQRHRRIQGGGGALQRQAVPTEDQLPLGGDELEEGQLQRSIWKERTAQKKMGRLSCKVPRG